MDFLRVSCTCGQNVLFGWTLVQMPHSHVRNCVRDGGRQGCTVLCGRFGLSYSSGTAPTLAFGLTLGPLIHQLHLFMNPKQQTQGTQFFIFKMTSLS